MITAHLTNGMPVTFGDPQVMREWMNDNDCRGLCVSDDVATIQLVQMTKYTWGLLFLGVLSRTARLHKDMSWDIARDTFVQVGQNIFVTFKNDPKVL